VDSIIRNRVYASLAVGLVPVPIADLGVLTTVQVELLYRLSKAYNIPFSRNWASKVLGIVLGSLAPVFFAPGLSGLLRYVPVVGQSLGLVGGSLTFGTATYLIGHAFAKRFAKGQEIDENVAVSIGEEIKAGFESGKKKVKSLFSRPKKEEAEAAADQI
jgi:uncharacterized protein (DUF697 family)